MIDRVVLNNFQSHKLSVLEFSPGVNAIVGSSDSGKSAILRALRWVIESRPSGEAYKLHGKDSVKVALDTNGKTIRRSRIKSSNSYELDDETFKAVGTSVPEPIESVLGFSDINVQSQMDAPFLLSSTPGEVARYLNGILGLDKIDASLAGVGSLYRESSSSIKSLEKSHVEYTETLLSERFAALPALEENLKLLIEDDELRDDLVLERARVSEIIESFENIEIPVVPDLDGVFSDVFGYGAELSKLIADKTLISESITEIANASNAVVLLAEKIEEYKIAVEEAAKESGQNICPTCGQLIPEGAMI